MHDLENQLGGSVVAPRCPSGKVVEQNVERAVVAPSTCGCHSEQLPPGRTTGEGGVDQPRQVRLHGRERTREVSSAGAAELVRSHTRALSSLRDHGVLIVGSGKTSPELLSQGMLE